MNGAWNFYFMPGSSSASCRPAESIFQLDGLEEVPTCGRAFFRFHLVFDLE
jgi:hypothetical protein